LTGLRYSGADPMDRDFNSFTVGKHKMRKTFLVLTLLLLAGLTLLAPVQA